MIGYGILQERKKTLMEFITNWKKTKTIKMGQYGKKIKFEYVSTIVEHKKAGKLKIVFKNQRESHPYCIYKSWT